MAQSLKERREACELFLAELGKGIPEHERVMAGYADEATVQADASGKKLNAGWWPTPYKAGRQIPMDENCYVCISSSIKTKNPKTGAERYWRGEASFGHGLALMVDDIGTGRGSKGELSMDQLCAILEPTAIVETSPGNHQCWYFLDEPTADRKKFKAFLLGFVSFVLIGKGGDSTIRDISRYGRMPAGINNKRTGDGQLKYPVSTGMGSNKPRPVDVRLVSADYRNRYSMDAIAAAFGFPIDVPVERKLSAEEVAALDEEKKFDHYWMNMAVRITSRLKMGEGSGGEVTQNMSGKYRIACPWGNEHTNGDPYGAYFRGSIPGAEYQYVFGCGHDTCRKENKRTWSVFIDHIVIPTIANNLDSANRRASENVHDYQE
jgi:hypothetical protein